MTSKIINLLQTEVLTESIRTHNSALDNKENINEFFYMDGDLKPLKIDSSILANKIPTIRPTKKQIKKSKDRMDKFLTKKDKEMLPFTLEISKNIENGINETIKKQKILNKKKQEEEKEEKEKEKEEEEEKEKENENGLLNEENNLDIDRILNVDPIELIVDEIVEEEEEEIVVAEVLAEVKIKKKKIKTKNNIHNSLKDSVFIEDSETQNTETQTQTLNFTKKFEIKKEKTNTNLKLNINIKNKENNPMEICDDDKDNNITEKKKEEEEDGLSDSFEFDMDEIGKVQKLENNLNENNGIKKSERKKNPIIHYNNDDFNMGGDYKTGELKRKYNQNFKLKNNEESESSNSSEEDINYDLKQNEENVFKRTKIIDNIDTVQFLKNIFIEKIGKIDKKYLIIMDKLTEAKLNDKSLFNIISEMFISQLNLTKDCINDSKKYRAIDLLEENEIKYHRLFGQIFCLELKNEDGYLFKLYHYIYNCIEYSYTRKNQTKTNIKFTFKDKKRKTFEKELIINSNMISIIESFNVVSNLSFYILSRIQYRLSSFKDKNQVNFDMRFLIDEYKAIRKLQLCVGINFFKD